MSERMMNGEDDGVVPFEREVVVRTVGEKAFTLDKFTRVEPSENRRWAHVENGMMQEVIGQEAAVKRLIAALYRGEGMRDPNTPISVIGLFGQTGTGKTHFVEMLDAFLHPGRTGEALTILNGTEFAQSHLVASLVDSPAEYAGREQKPKLDKKKIEQPYSIVLIDKFEKAHPDFHDLFMQAFDKGTITLQNGGQTINFNNAIFILTSNLGALSKPISFGLNSTMQNQAGEKNIEHAVAMALNRLRPEFVNRIEEKIVFSSLNDGQIGQALERYVARRNKDYRSKYGVEVTLSPALIKELVESCDTDFEDRRMYNARPVIQKYKRMIEGRISQSCIEGGIVPGSQIYGTLADQSSKDQKIDERIEIWRAKDKSIVKKGSVVSDKKNSLEKKDAAKPAALIDL